MLQTQNLPSTYQQSIKNKQFNTSALTIWAEEDFFYLEPNYSKCLIPTGLIIDRKKNKIKQIKIQEFKPPKTANPIYVSFFIGIVDLNGKKIIMLSQTVQIVCTISKRQIFKITKPIFLFYKPSEKNNLTDQQAKILINLVTIFQEGMYFSYAYNLTEPLHHIKKIDIYKVNSFFNWAQPFQSELANCNIMWSLPVIQGFVNKIQLYTNAQKLRIVLISRRSLKQGGPWQYNCGLTQKGHSANYVQTQQILCINNYLFSFLQIRGSAPIMWSQKFSYGVPSGVSLQRSIQQNYKAFKLHISNMLLNRSYENIILFNLLSKESSSQKRLIQNFQYLVKLTERDKVLGVQGKNVNNNKNKIGIHYVYFDFHTRCPNKNYRMLNKFINQEMETILLSCGFTAISVKQQEKTYEILNVQKGVIRTNCGTCIDRTNISQCRLAAYQLVYIFNQLNIKLSFFNKNLDFIDDESSFGKLYRNLWADNADNISRQYTGTGSINSVAVRKGGLSYMTTIDHGMKSLVRALRNVRQEDEQKNKTVIFLMRRFRQMSSLIGPKIESKQNLINFEDPQIKQAKAEKQLKVQAQKQKNTEPQSLI